jgi:hypothetical protein
MVSTIFAGPLFAMFQKNVIVVVGWMWGRSLSSELAPSETLLQAAWVQANNWRTNWLLESLVHYVLAAKNNSINLLKRAYEY